MCISRNTIVFFFGFLCLVFQHRRLTFILLNLKMLSEIPRQNVHSIYQCTKRTLEHSFTAVWQNSSDVELLRKVLVLGAKDPQQMFTKDHHQNEDSTLTAVVSKSSSGKEGESDSKQAHDNTNANDIGNININNNSNNDSHSFSKLMTSLRIALVHDAVRDDTLQQPVVFEDYQFAVQHLLANYLLIERLQTQAYNLILAFVFGVFITYIK
jgi:hypothetical protein